LFISPVMELDLLVTIDDYFFRTNDIVMSAVLSIAICHPASLFCDLVYRPRIT
jgi:hypothetical protein